MKLPPAFTIETEYLPSRQAKDFEARAPKYLKKISFGYSTGSRYGGRRTRSRSGNEYLGEISTEQEWRYDKKARKTRVVITYKKSEAAARASGASGR